MLLWFYDVVAQNNSSQQKTTFQGRKSTVIAREGLLKGISKAV